MTTFFLTLKKRVQIRDMTILAGNLTCLQISDWTVPGCREYVPTPGV